MSAIKTRDPEFSYDESGPIAVHLPGHDYGDVEALTLAAQFWLDEEATWDDDDPALPEDGFEPPRKVWLRVIPWNDSGSGLAMMHHYSTIPVSVRDPSPSCARPGEWSPAERAVRRPLPASTTTAGITSTRSIPPTGTATAGSGSAVGAKLKSPSTDPRSTLRCINPARTADTLSAGMNATGKVPRPRAGSRPIPTAVARARTPHRTRRCWTSMTCAPSRPSVRPTT